jgi:hypothetical protein
MHTYTVEVDYTDRQRDNGQFVVVTRTVDVAATDDQDAIEAAVQLVSALRQDTVGGMAVAARIVSVVM